MRQIGQRRLWIGHAGDLLNPRSILALGVEAIIELADNEQFAEFPRDLLRMRFPLSDGGDNSEWLLRLVIGNLVNLIRAEIPTIVCCSYGANRSVCVVAAAISINEIMEIDSALQLVVALGPADVSPALWNQTRKCAQAFCKPPMS